MRKLVALFIFFVVGCQVNTPEQNSGKAYFDIAGFTNALIKAQALQKSHVSKISFANGVNERVAIDKVDTTFWKTELTPLINADINKPSFKDVYQKQEGLTEETSNLHKIVYEALPNTNASVKRIEIKYLNSPSEVRQIVAVVSKNNPVYDSWQEVHLWTNKYGTELLIDSLEIAGYNKTILQDSLTYKSRVIVMR